MKSKTLLQFSNINFGHSPEELLFNNLSGSVEDHSHIGLAAPNGTGKSTLFKILAGEIESQGEVNTYGNKIVYLPQLNINKYKSEQYTYEYLQGQIADWWVIDDYLKRIFNESLAETKKLNQLSGGELVKINIALAFAQKPDLVLLDEPTNHLDIEALKDLSSFLNQSEIAYILVSHNQTFLNTVTKTIWELSDKKIKIYGGNFNFYREQKQIESKAKEQDYLALKKKSLKAKKELQKEQIKFQSAQSKLRKLAKSNDRSMPKIIRNAIKINGQVMHGQNKQKINKQIQALDYQLVEKIPTKKRSIHLDLHTFQAKGILTSIAGDISTPNGEILIKELDLDIYRTDKLAIIGKNGSGKSYLAKVIADQVKGAIYLDQDYKIIDHSQNLIDNMMRFCPNINYEDARKALGGLEFTTEVEIIKKASSLSGGQIAKLAIAMATSADKDLLILDEPSNNLDFETVTAIADALRLYQGALILISHDLEFIKQLGIKQTLLIKNRQLLSEWS